MQRVFVAALCGTVVVAGAHADPGGQSIGQRGKVFSVTETSSPVGGTIRIVNDDAVAHSLLLTAPDGKRRGFGTQKPGDHTDITLDQAGDYMARCGIHPGMKLLIHTQ